MNAFCESFAGGGVVRAGIGRRRQCLFVKDPDSKNGASNRACLGDDETVVADVRGISLDDPPDRAELAWSSFPCQYMSPAGTGAGLRGELPGAIRSIMGLLRELAEDRRHQQCSRPRTLPERLSRAWEEIYRAFATCRTVCIVAERSRRMWHCPYRNCDCSSPTFAVIWRSSPHHLSAIRNAQAALSDVLAPQWMWWNMPRPPKRERRLVYLVDKPPNREAGAATAEIGALLSTKSRANLVRVDAAKSAGVRMAGGTCKRARIRRGINVQRAKARFDGVAICPHPPASGVCRQIVLIVEGGKVRTRSVSAWEPPQWMCHPDRCILQASRKEACQLTGNGAAAPVGRYIARCVIDPIIERIRECSCMMSTANWKHRQDRNCRRQLEPAAANDAIS